jgi:hypothetical protein
MTEEQLLEVFKAKLDITQAQFYEILEKYDSSARKRLIEANRYEYIKVATKTGHTY